MRKRDFRDAFEFIDYEVTTGHVSAYYEFGNGFVGQVDAGRYLAGDNGATRMVRSCVEGPVFRGDRIRWDAFADGLCSVPEDAVGAAGMRAH